ncbi:MAG TPA: hypothetical protein VFG51_02195 [Candidatus Saccharimonadia bacterium]|nr:hypothetical protein [Candidatus Saccharimonadia bacterium]
MKTYTNEDITKKNPSYAREHPAMAAFLVLFVIAVVGSIGWYIFQAVVPQKPKAALQWSGITAGTSTTADLQKTLGTPVAESKQGENDILSYKSSYQAFPHQVITRNGVVVFIEEWVPPESNSMLQDYVTQFGAPDFTSHLLESGIAYTLSVFLKKGIAVDAHTESGKVFHVLYFVPTTQQQFMTDFQSYIAPPGQTGP